MASQTILKWNDEERERLVNARIALEDLHKLTKLTDRSKFWKLVKERANLGFSVKSTTKQFHHICYKYKSLYKEMSEAHSSEEEDYEIKDEDLSHEWFLFDRIHKWALQKPNFVEWVAAIPKNIKKNDKKNKKIIETNINTVIDLTVDDKNIKTTIDNVNSDTIEICEELRESDIEQYEDLKQNCRFCLKYYPLSSHLHSIFNKNIDCNQFDYLDIPNSINLITGLIIEENDEFPQNICLDCLTQLDNCIKFRNNCRLIYDQLNNMLLNKINNSTKCFEMKNNEDYYSYIKHEEAIDIYESEDNTNQEVECETQLTEIKIEKIDESDFPYENQDKEVAVYESQDKVTVGVGLGQKKKLNDDMIKEILKKRSIKNVKRIKRLYRSRVKQKVAEKKQCPICGALVYSLRHHSYSHDRTAEFKCNICSATYTQPASLWAHKMTHNNGKRFECDVCQKSFATRDCLKKHKIRHLPGKFKCSICEKTFTVKTDLIRHQRVHTGERPYKCDICDSSFSTQASRKVHMDMVHLHVANKFECTHCSNTFKYKRTLEKHIKKLHGITK